MKSAGLVNSETSKRKVCLYYDYARFELRRGITVLAYDTEAQVAGTLHRVFKVLRDCGQLRCGSRANSMLYIISRNHLVQA